MKQPWERQLELVELQVQEEQPWQRMAGMDTCRCNQVEGTARKRQAK